MKVEANTIEELIENSGNHKGTIAFLDEMVQQIAPELDRTLFKGGSITMIAYGLLPYHTKQYPFWPIIGIAPQKNTANMYVSVFKNEKYLPEFYGKELGEKISCGKSCIRIKNQEQINIAGFEAMIKDAVEYFHEKKNKSK